MGYPELYSDERIILQAQNVKVKSVSFEAILTTRRLVLVDSKKNTIPPQEINLATLKDVEAGENAIRDPTITISIITVSGAKRQMILTFSKAVGGERKRECDDWVKILKQNLATSIQHPVSAVPPAPVREQAPPPVQAPVSNPPPPQRRIEITNAPLQKKKIEIARPMKKVVEPAPTMPVPVETSSLPTGSFCNRCGSRIPAESAFCNRCGTPVVKDDEMENPENAPVITAPASGVQQIHIPAQPVFSTAGERKERPIEEVIHSIEPLIEDSVPRTEPSPLVPGRHHQGQPVSSPEEHAPSGIPVAGPVEINPITDIKWPVITPSETFEPSQPATPAPVLPGPAYSSPPPPGPGRSRLVTIAVLVLVVIAVLAGVYMFMKPQGGVNGGTPVITTGSTVIPTLTTPPTTRPTPVPTTAPAVTPTQQPTAQIPTTGVWVRIQYTGKYSGSVGTPGVLLDVTDTGDHFYRISTSGGVVVATIQKTDGSGAELSVEVYKDGVQIKKSTTTTPKGVVEIQLSLKPAVTPSPETSVIPVVTVLLPNSTNTTGSS